MTESTPSGLTCIRQLTPPGRGAVAVILAQMTQNHAAQSFRRCFKSHSGRDPATAAINRILSGSWRGEDVVIVRVAPDAWEVHCHGGPAAVNRIARDLSTSDETSGTPGPTMHSGASEFRLEAELRRELLKCRTQTTAVLLLAQLQGRLRDFLNSLSEQTSVDAIHRGLQQLQRWRSMCEHFSEPWKVVVIGQPNAGKSSLLNAIVGFERSIVFDQPGTTRDRVEVDVTLNGWPFRLIDTAGIRDIADSETEARGIAAAVEALNFCDACLLIVDAIPGWSPEDDRLMKIIPPTVPFSVLMNKSDVSPRSFLPSSLARDQRASAFRTSARDGSGLKEVLDWMANVLVPETPTIETPLPACPSAADLCDRLQTLISENARLRIIRDTIRQFLDAVTDDQVRAP
ncbi:MAG: GTPase [Planctomycetaceae bacterium]